MEGIIRLHEAIQAGDPARLRAAERRLVTDWAELPGVDARRGGPRRDDARRRAGARCSRPAPTCATRRASTSSRTSRPPTTSAGADTGVSGYIGTAAGRDLNLPMTQGLQALPEPKPKRFARQLPPALGLARRRAAVRVQTLARRRRARAERRSPVWPTADWHEREAFDLMGIAVRRPPEPEADPPRRRLGRAPAAQGLPDRRRAGPLLGGRVVAIAPERTRASIYEGTRIPRPIPTVLRVPDELARDRRRPDDQLRAEPPLDPRRAPPDRRPLRRGRGRPRGGRSATSTPASRRTWSRRRGGRRSPIPERIDYLSLPGQRARLRARDREAARARDAGEGRRGCARCLCELNRIHSHLVWLGTAGARAGAISMFWYCFREREQILDLFEMVCGARMHTRYFQAGGLAEDIPRGFFPEARRVRRTGCRTRSTSTRRCVDRNKIWLERTVRASACSRPTTRSRSGSRARCCAPRASTGTCARSSPTSPTARCDFRVPVYREGDVYARYRVHMEEMRESMKIIAPVPRPARGDGRRAVDRGRPQGRAAAARGAPHLDGVAHPPLQDRHRGLPRPRGRGVRRRSSRPAASSAATSSPTAARGRGA